MKYNIINIREHEEWVERAANWFHSKWNVPVEAYLESMQQCIELSIVPSNEQHASS